MDCNHVRPLLPAHADRELGVQESIEVERHLASCAACQHEYAGQTTLSTAVRQHATYHQSPSHLEHRIRAALPVQPARAGRTPVRRWNWLNAGAALASLFALVWSVGLYMALPSADDRLAEELVTSHVRSLMPNHLVDVASSDQHTVKPWFNGKLDFSPTVNDYAAQGFPLIGGRLDYVNQRPVAALVYQHRKHVINLYVWPTGVRDETPAREKSRQGYNVMHWTEQGMTYWAVSDLNRDELGQFRTTLQRPPA